MDKFGYAKPQDLERVFSEEDTLRHIRKQICDKRREDFGLIATGLTRFRARLAWTQLGEWAKNQSFSDTVGLQRAVDNLYNDAYKDLLFVIGPDPIYIYEDSFQFRDSSQYTFLIETLLPFFQNYLRTAVLNLPARRSA